MSATLRSRVSLRRLVFILVLAAAASVVFVPGAGAGNFDEQRMGCAGEDPAVCATGTVGEPYSLKVYLQGDEDTGCAVISVTSGSLPPGLSITQQFNETKAAVISGTPTEASSFSFYLNVNYENQGCPKPESQDRFIIPINPEIPKLVLGPEQDGVMPATVGTPYSLQMTSTLPEAKTWSITSGELPPGLTIGQSDGLIAGTPTTAGTFSFTVYAKVNADTRSDTKALSVTVRNPLVAQGPGGSGSRGVPASEIGVPFEAVVTATGGTESFTWSLTSGELPPGVALAADGTISGTPRAAGRFRFTATVTDTEVPTPRTASYTGVVNVAARLDVATQRLRPGKVGKLYRAKLKALGGVKPTVWKVKKGPLPRGIRLDRKLGVLSGTPRKAGKYRIVLEVTDELGVKSTQSLVIVVTAPKT
jgi:hypothetical protein